MTKKKTKKPRSKQVVYQEHHPDKAGLPDYTIRLRRNHHLFVWRQVQSLRVCNDTLVDLINLKRSIEFEIDKRAKILAEIGLHASINAPGGTIL